MTGVTAYRAVMPGSPEGAVLVLILILISVAGCTGSVPSVPPVTSTPVTETTTPPAQKIPTAVTSAPQPVTAVQVTATAGPVKIFNGEYHWAEYRINYSTSYNPGHRVSVEYTAKNERSSELYKGIPAVHEKITVTGDTINWTGNFEKIIIKNGYRSTQHLFFERSTKRFLGGTFVASGGAMDKPEEILSGDETYCPVCFRSWLVITPFDEMNISLTADGVESVTVPAGTYPGARKYSGNIVEDSLITFWVAEGIPVPVQYRIQNFPGADGDDPLESYELAGWG